MNLHNLSVRRRRSIIVPFCRHRAKKQRVQDRRGHEHQSPHQNLGLDDSQTYGQIITPGSLPSRGLYKVLNSFKKRLVLIAQPQLQSQCVLQVILSSWHTLARLGSSTVPPHDLPQVSLQKSTQGNYTHRGLILIDCQDANLPVHPEQESGNLSVYPSLDFLS